MNETRNGIPMATDIPQSRRLLACGVGPDSADMSIDTDTEKLYLGRFVNRVDKVHEIPAWSLSTLLSMLPQRAIAPHGNTPCDLYIHHYPEFWLVMYHDDKSSGDAEDYTWQCASEQRAETLVEACVKMIEWLKL